MALTNHKQTETLLNFQSGVLEARTEVDVATERGKRAAAETAHLAEELGNEQERSIQADQVSLGFQVKVVNDMTWYCGVG